MNRVRIQYCLIAFAVTWFIGFCLVVAVRQGRLSPEAVSLYHSFAALGPAIGAVVVAGFVFLAITLVKQYGRGNRSPVARMGNYFK